MKKLAILGAALALIFTFCFSLTAVRADDSAKELKILSFNIRLSYGEVGKPTEWKNRKGLVSDIMRAGDYGFIGIQEAIITQKPGLNQVEDLKALLPEYGLLTRSRMVSETEGESTPIMWRKDRWEMDEQEHGVFWLSDTPDVPQSITWENACPRTVVWGKFHELADGKRTGRVVYFINTHFDHVSEKARQLSGVAIADFVAKHVKPGEIAFVTGDFNSGENSQALKYLKGEEAEIQAKDVKGPIAMVDTYRVVNPDEKDVQTFHGFGTVKFSAKIDYILMYGDLKVKSAKIIRDKTDIYPSDHYPIDAVMEF
jgi:endonuclease/exonuclease/phosphatase family metal-dependent hydrolase